MKKNKQITLTIEEWMVIDYHLGPHRDSENPWKNEYGEQSEYEKQQEILWDKEYEFTQKAIEKLNKKLYTNKQNETIL
jgi:hypothetical protein